MPNTTHRKAASLQSEIVSHLSLASATLLTRSLNCSRGRPWPHLICAPTSARCFQRVTSAYGIVATFDPQLEPKSDLRFSIQDADFRTAMEALTDVTGTFVFPISAEHVFVARDTETKRQETGSRKILLTFPLPNALDQKDLIEAANAVRSVLNSHAVGWDSVSRTVMVRDRVTRARVAYALLESHIAAPKRRCRLRLRSSRSTQIAAIITVWHCRLPFS